MRTTWAACLKACSAACASPTSASRATFELHIRPDARRARLGRVDAFGTGRKHLVLDLDEFGGLPRRRQGFRHHKHDALADETHAIQGKRVVRRHEDGLSVAVGQGYVGRTDCERRVDQRLQPVGQIVGRR